MFTNRKARSCVVGKEALKMVYSVLLGVWSQPATIPVGLLEMQLPGPSLELLNQR